MSSRPRTPAFPTASSVFGRSSRFDTHSDSEVPRYGGASEAANERHQMMDLDVGAPVIAALLQNMYRQMNNSANPLQPKPSQSPTKKRIDVSQMTDEGDMTLISAMLRNRFSDSSQISTKDKPPPKIDMGNINFRPRPDGQNIQKLLAHSWSQGPCTKHPLGRSCSQTKPSSGPKLKRAPKFVEQNKQLVKSLSNSMLSVKGLGRSGVFEVTESVLGHHKDKPKTALEQLTWPSKTNKIYYPPNYRRQNSEVAFGSGAERDANVPSTKDLPVTPGGYDTSGNYAQPHNQSKRHNYGLKLGNYEDVEGAYEARKAMKDSYLVVSDQQAIQLLRAKLEQRLASKANGGLRAAFKVFDRDGSGSVAIEELGAVFSNLNLELPPKQIQSLMKIFDADGSGIIDYNEFIGHVLGDEAAGADILRGKAAPLATVKKDAFDRPQTPSDKRPLSATPVMAPTENAERKQSKPLRPTSSTGFSMLNSIGPYDPQNYRTIMINNSIQQRIWQYRDCFRSIVQGSSVVPRSFVKDILCKVDGTDSWSDQMVDIICSGAEVEEATSHRMERPSTGMRSTRFGTNDRSAVIGVILRNLRACAQEAMLESVASVASRPSVSTFSPTLRAVVARGIKL
jgi:hypothetical protein